MFVPQQQHTSCRVEDACNTGWRNTATSCWGTVFFGIRPVDFVGMSASRQLPGFRDLAIDVMMPYLLTNTTYMMKSYNIPLSCALCADIAYMSAVANICLVNPCRLNPQAYSAGLRFVRIRIYHAQCSWCVQIRLYNSGGLQSRATAPTRNP